MAKEITIDKPAVKGREAKPSKKDKKAKLRKNGKPRRNPIRFIKETIAELKKVSWPSRKALISYTGAVLAFIVLMTIIIGVIDLGMTQLFNLMIR